MNSAINAEESNDFQWIDETLQGNVRSFSTIIKKYQDRIYTLALKSVGSTDDAKDIAQSVFVNAFTSLKNFRRESSFQTWLYRIAINQIKNHWRSNKYKRVIKESDLKLFNERYGYRVTNLTDVEDESESEETKQFVCDMISFLPIEQRQMFVCYYISGYSCAEIAEIFKTSPSNVKIQLFRGRKFLFQKFKNLF